MAESTATQTADVGPIRRARASLAALETLDRLRQAPHMSPTSEDLAALRGWSGWGPLATCQALGSVARFAAANSADSKWHDADGNAIHPDDVPALLGTLAESTIANGYCNREVAWRGMTIDFTSTRNRGEEQVSARIITGDNRHRLDVPLNTAWTVKGQHWRIRDAIAAAVENAHLGAAETRANIEVLQQQIAENEAAIGQPFELRWTRRESVVPHSIWRSESRLRRTRRHVAIGVPAPPKSPLRPARRSREPRCSFECTQQFLPSVPDLRAKASR